MPSGALRKEEAPLGSEPAFQQCGRTGLRSSGGRGTLGFAPLLKRGNQEQKQSVSILLCELASVLLPTYPHNIRKPQLKPSQTPEQMLRCLSPGLNWLMGLCSSPPTPQGDTSKPQLLSEAQDSCGLAKKKGKDNGTATTTTAAHCHIPEGHLQSPIPATSQKDIPRAPS